MSQRHEYRLPPFDRLRSTSSTSSAAIKRPQEIAHFSYVPHTPLPSNAPCPSNLRHYGSTLDPPPTHASHSQDGQSRHNSSSRVEKEADSNSHSRSRVLHHDARAIKYYYSPEIGASLSEGFESFQQLDNEEDEHLDGLLACVSHLEMLRRGGDGLQRGERVFEDSDGGTTQGGHRDWKIKPDFMTWRGMMTKIMAAPYSNFDGFEMNATLFDGTIYIEECHTAKLASRAQQAAQQRPRRPGQPGQELMSFWGYKFETLCMLPNTWDDTSRKYIETRPKHVVNNYEQYISVVQTGIGDLGLVLGGEVDGVWDGLPTSHEQMMQPQQQDGKAVGAEGPSTIMDRPNYIELKTSAEHEYILSLASSQEMHEHRLYAKAHPNLPGTHIKQPHPAPRPKPSHMPTTASLTRYNRKLLKFWIQSFLLGIPKTIVGFRTNDAEGRLLRVEEFPTTQIPRMVAESVAQHPASRGVIDDDFTGRGGRGSKPLEAAWEKDVCINFAQDFLTFVKDVVHKDAAARGGADGGVWKIRRVDRSPVIEVSKVEESRYGDILSREFVEWRISGDALRAAREGALERLHRDVWAGDG